MTINIMNLGYLKISKRMISFALLSILGFSMLFSYASFLFAFESPIQKYPLTVSVNIFDEGGEIPVSFSEGSTIVIESTVHNTNTDLEEGGFYFDYYDPGYPVYGYNDIPTGKPVNFRLILTVLDSEGYPVYFHKTKHDLSSEETKEYVSTFIHTQGLPTGTYTVRVMVWDEFLVEGIALSSEVGYATFNVVGAT